MIGGAELCFIFPTATPYLMNKFRDRNQPMTQERLHVSPPRFEHLTDALGIGVAAPRLSWIVETPVQGWRQAAYAVEAYTPDGAPVAATGRLDRQRIGARGLALCAADRAPAAAWYACASGVRMASLRRGANSHRSKRGC
jgi:hypothetical protein